MRVKVPLLTLLSGVLLLGAGCTPPPVPSEPAVPQQPTSQPAENTTGGTGELGDQKFILYTNQAVGYSVLRPDNWYWRHYIANEIGSASADDYFITDPNPLPGLGSEHLGQIVIEVSKRPLTDFADGVQSLTKRSVTVAGIAATRYDGTRTTEQAGEQKVIEYQFTNQARSYRLIYVNAVASQDQEDIFEQVVAGFSWSNQP